MCDLNNIYIKSYEYQQKVHSKKIGVLPNPKNAKNSFDGATKPKKVLPLNTNSKPFVRNLISFASNPKRFVLNPKDFEFEPLFDNAPIFL